MSTPELSPLGRAVDFPDHVARDILFAIPRAAQRDVLGLGGSLPFQGEDIWTAYELSWLDPFGKPRVAIATLRVPCDSPSIIESKSLKLYLNGYAHTRQDDAAVVASRIAEDLSTCCGAEVAVELWPDASMDVLAIGWLAGTSIDEVDVRLEPQDEAAAHLLTVAAGAENIDADVDETLVSRLFRSNCPVTGQPDWADVQVRYRGRAIDHGGLLAYLVSYREHRGFHEQCVERIFLDIKARCAPAMLTVYARFTRRGGLDINPWRSDDPAFAPPENVRTARQ